MHPYKFRALQKGKWKYFGLFDGPAISLDMDTIGQFTGLRDKHGEEIYAGDIVQHRRFTRPDDGVKYGIVMQMLPNVREVTFEAYGFTPFVGWREEAIAEMEWEVIGNIHEHPHLLQV